jgi:hypothetical protein
LKVRSDIGKNLLMPELVPDGLPHKSRLSDLFPPSTTTPTPTVNHNPISDSHQSTQLLKEAHTAKMLRRKPTTITLTTEDIANYEDARAREAQLREQAAYQAQLQAQQQALGTPNKNQNLRNPNDELRPLPAERVGAQQVKSREERLGLTGGGGNSRG